MDLYDIPMIQPDLRHEETIIQIANAFDLLQQVITEVFDKVDSRIALNSKVIQDIDVRIDRINNKIDKLSNDYESIEIQSSCDYPPEKLFKDIPITLTMANRRDINLNRNYHIESGPDCNISKTYDKKLQFYYVRQPKRSNSSAGPVATKDVHGYLESGLGSIPPYVESVNGLLLFNKSENVFDKKMQKNLRRFEKSTIRYYDPVLSDGPGDMEKAPPSITNRQLLNMRIRKNLFMATQWNDDEQIDIPITLPDVGTRDKKKKKIVNSNEEELTQKISKEPEPVQIKSVPPNGSEIKSAKTNNKLKISGSVVDSAPAAPPVPPPMDTKEAATSRVDGATSKVDGATPKVDGATPKVDGATPKVDGATPKVEVATPKVQPPKLNSNTQDRSTLMEAIRQAGGAQKMKKKVNAEQVEPNDQTEKQKQPVPFSSGSLMDDLHKKLALRRKGISGNKDLAQGSNVMDGISAMIPPPPPKQSESSSESESNEDWN